MVDLFRFAGIIYEFLLENKWVLWGHQVFPLGVIRNLLYPLQTLQILRFYSKAQKDGKKYWMLFWLTAFVLWLPNSLYLFLEIKHVLFVDNIIDDGDPVGILFFIGLSIFGLVITVYTIKKAVETIDILKRNKVGSIFVLSMLSGFGAMLGIQDVLTEEVFFNLSKVLGSTVGLVTSPQWAFYALVLGLFTALICLGSRKIF